MLVFCRKGITAVREVWSSLWWRVYMQMTQCCWLSEGMLQRIVDEFNRVCKRRKLKVNAGKSKVMVFERADN